MAEPQTARNGSTPFRRAEQRQGPIPTSVRIFQGVGGIPSTLKELAFQNFLLLFYNQVQGLPAIYTSIALAIALAIDAVSDPLVGAYSDNFRHRLGRRHPLMLAATVPFALCLWALFSPPALTEVGLFCWLVAFAVLTRVCMTFYVVPWNAMYAELSEDYEERSILISYRFAMGWLAAIVFTFSIYSVAFPGNEATAQGQLLRANYDGFAVILATAVVLAALATTLLTLNQVRFLPQPTEDVRFSPRVFVVQFRQAFANQDFRLLVLAVLAAGVVSGTNNALQMYVNTYFWGFGPDALRFMALTFVGGFLAFVTVPFLQRAFDKKYIVVGCALAIMFVTAVPVTMRFLGLAPDNGTPELIALVVGATAFVGFFGTLGLIMFASMVADTLDVQEYETGLRQEGLFSSATTFSGKVTTAAGLIIAGVLLDSYVGMADGATGVTVSAEAVVRLGILEAYAVPVFNLIWLVLALKYGITRARHAEVQAALIARRRSLDPNLKGR